MSRPTGRTGTVLALLMLPALALAQVSFVRRWHWFREDIGRSVALAADGGYLVGGETWVESSQYGVVVAQTDSLGDTTAVHHLLNVDHGSGYACARRGGGFVASGTRSTWHVFAQAFGPAGDSVWTYYPGRLGRVYSLTATSDGGYLIAGQDSAHDMGAFKLDSLGSEEWVRSYDEPYVQGSTTYGVAETRDRGFILCGDATDYLGSYVRLVRTDSLGDTLWTCLYSGPVGPSLQAVCQTPDLGFLTVGSEFDTLQSQNAVYLMRFDSGGAVTWTRGISIPGAGTEAMALLPTHDSGYIVAGSIDWGDSARAWLMKLDADADTVWTSVLPGTGRERATSIRETRDGGYVVAGTSDSAGGSILLIKTDSLGHVQLGVAESRTVSPERVGLAVRPNPARGVVQVECSLPVGTGPVRLNIYDSQGRLVRTSAVTSRSRFSVNLSSMPAGVYLVRLHSGPGSTARKLVID